MPLRECRRRADRGVHLVRPRVGGCERARRTGGRGDRRDRLVARDAVHDREALRRLREQPRGQHRRRAGASPPRPSCAARAAPPSRAPPAPRGRRPRRRSCPSRTTATTPGHGAHRLGVERDQAAPSGSAAAGRARAACPDARDPGRSASYRSPGRPGRCAVPLADDAIVPRAASARTAPVAARFECAAAEQLPVGRAPTVPARDTRAVLDLEPLHGSLESRRRRARADGGAPPPRPDASPRRSPPSTGCRR